MHESQRVGKCGPVPFLARTAIITYDDAAPTFDQSLNGGNKTLVGNSRNVARVALFADTLIRRIEVDDVRR